MATVLIYDSGVGGLSIYNNIVCQSPELDLVFLSDNQAFPYGTKNEAELSQRVMSVVKRIDQHYAPDVLVVACNTASTLVLDQLRAHFDFSVVGVVPAIKPAAKLSQTKHIGLLATPATVERSYTQDLINEFAQECVVTRVGSSELVRLAESKLRGETIEIQKIASILEPIIENDKLDVLVLACTHFPLLNNEIAQALSNANRDVLLIDSGDAIANRVRSLCSALSNHGNEPDGDRTATFTETLDEPSLFSQLEKLGFEQIEILDS